MDSVMETTPQVKAADDLQKARLFTRPELRALIRILNQADRESPTWDRDFYARPLADRLHIERVAHTALSLLDIDVIDQAIEAMAERSAEIDYDGQRPFSDLPASIQARTRRTCQSLLRTARAVLGRMA